MEAIIKSAQELKLKSVDHARILYNDYQQRQSEVRVAAHQLDFSVPALVPEDDPIPPK